MNVPDGLAERPLNRLLKIAVLAGVESAVRMHVRRGDDLDARDGDGMTPLMLAASKNKAGICALLLASGADPSLKDSSGRDALGIAEAMGASEAAGVLASHGPKGAEPNLVDSEPGLQTTTADEPKRECDGEIAAEAEQITLPTPPPEPSPETEAGVPFDTRNDPESDSDAAGECEAAGGTEGEYWVDSVEDLSSWEQEEDGAPPRGGRDSGCGCFRSPPGDLTA